MVEPGVGRPGRGEHGDRDWIEAQERAWLGVWEVEDARPGTSLELRRLGRPAAPRARWQERARGGATGVAGGREQVDALLKDIENREARLPAAERFDVAPIRRALGL